MEPTVYSPEVQEQLSHFVMVSWILLIPLGVLLVIVLYKLVFLLHTVSEFLGLARYEVFPLLQTVQHTAHNVDVLTTKAVSSIESVEKGLHAVTPAVKDGMDNIRSRIFDVRGNLGSLFKLFFRK